VQQMQQALFERGYLRKSEIDGDFGKITLGAVLAFQFENKLEVDGVCGQKTKAALKLT
jgi:peptidoglycan hydrolase-like protein with peptidoglycan-binding domain